MHTGKHHALYNESAQNTLHKQILLNIVRLRYSEPPYFVSHNTVADHRSTFNKLSHFIQSTVAGASKQSSGIETYPEWNRLNFSKQFMTSLEPEIIEKLINHGWGIERVFRILVKRLGSHINVESRSGPIPHSTPEFEDFRTLARLLQEAHLQNKLKSKPRQKKKKSLKEKQEETPPLLMKKSCSFPFLQAQKKQIN